MSDGLPSDTVLAPFARLREAWRSDGGLTLDQRRDALKRLRSSLIDRAEAYVKAIDADFRGRSRHETLLAEIAVCVTAIDDTSKKMRRWMTPSRISLGYPFWPARGELRPQPRGVVGIVAPGNYPLQLAIMPLIGALSAGCRALIKPSEQTPRTADLIAEHVASAFDPDIAGVVVGDAGVSADFCALPFDLLLFTGSPRVGRIVAKAAADNLVPTILELGGKSPVVIDRGADLPAAARSIAAGKLLNAGQTCVAPDYVLVPREMRDALVAELKTAATALYPNANARDYTSVASDPAIDRLDGLVEGHDTVTVLDVDEPRVALRLVLDPPRDSAVMRQEIFGPVLPILGYDDIDAAIGQIRALPSPLVLSWFGERNDRFERVVASTQSGAVSVNETVLYAGINALPFGGIGQSGIGRYHGKAGFDAFSHERVMFYQSRFSLPRMMRPPYGKRVEMALKSMLRQRR